MQVRLSVMESDFEASRGVANAGMANAGIIHELMQALPVLERRLSEARRRREVLQSQVAPVLASCSGDLPGLVELRRFADQTRDACSMICSKSDALEVMHVEAVDGATCCMHQMESHVQQMVVEKQHGDAARELAKDQLAELQAKLRVQQQSSGNPKEVQVLRGEVKHLGEMLQNVANENVVLKQKLANTSPIAEQRRGPSAESRVGLGSSGSRRSDSSSIRERVLEGVRAKLPNTTV